MNIYKSFTDSGMDVIKSIAESHNASEVLKVNFNSWFLNLILYMPIIRVHMCQLSVYL